MDPRNRVIVVGCGPVGMMVALGLHKAGIPVTVLEQEPETVEDQRAATLHLSSVELLDELGFFDDIKDLGIVAPLYHFRDRVTGDLVAEFDHRMLKDETRFPYAFQYEQFKLVDSIIAHIGDTPDVSLRFSCKVVDVAQSADEVRVAIENEEGGLETVTGAYVVGCDGAWSTVRQIADIEFEGFTYPERFVKIGTTFDFFAAKPEMCTRNFYSDPEEWANFFHVNGYEPPGIWRGVFPTRVDETDEEIMSDEGIQRRLQRFFPKNGDYPIAYTGLYVVHQRVAETFNKGRILLAGDSAHVNNPIGGLGMNGGLHDAANLVEKLDAVINRGEDAAVLDRYSRQRRKAQLDSLQAQSIANKKLMEARDPKVRKQQLDDIRRTAEDPERHKAYLRKSSLLESREMANAVA